MSSYYDLSLLPPAEFQFVVIADSHYMIDPGDKPLEFESRRHQTARAEVAFRLAESIDADFVIHMGDLTQEYPVTAAFRQARLEALEQIRRFSFKVYHVAGNQDIGDKPDDIMNTDPVKPHVLEEYHKDIGPSWYSFNHGGCHFVVVNSQILNSDLPEREEQREWLEKDLQECQCERILLFFHLPAYLWDEKEKATGHYDNIGQPDRAWLLGLVKEYKIELAAAGHVHYQFFDRIEQARYFTLVSPSFTRPGFGYLYNSAPPPERGRDDAAKLGIFLFRVMADRVDVHLLRTSGETSLPVSREGMAQRLVTRMPHALSRSALGLTLRHQLTPNTEVPIAFPSIIRQKVRNDYPFLSCLELGVNSVRIPWTDLRNDFQLKRLSMLQAEGVSIQAFLPEGEVGDVPDLVSDFGDRIERWEIQITGSPQPSPETFEVLKELGPEKLKNVALTTLFPGEKSAGKQHMRTRIGFLVEELVQLNDWLVETGLKVGNALCRIDQFTSPWEFVKSVWELKQFSQIGAVDFIAELPWLDDAKNSRRATEALFAMALMPGSKIYFDPLIDVDRTMDISHGLLDPLCNPRPPFHALRCLNTILFEETEGSELKPEEVEMKGMRAFQLASAKKTWFLILPEGQEGVRQLPESISNESGRVCDLEQGTVQAGKFTEIALKNRPNLLVF